MWHFDVPTKTELATLANLREPNIVSIYLPTTPVTPEAHKDSITLSNLAKSAVERLEGLGAAKSDIGSISDQLDDIVEDFDFWANQGHGLGVIVTPTHHWTFRLPQSPEESLTIGDRPAVIPLAAAMSEVTAFQVLALSEGKVRLIDVEGDLPPREINVSELPESAADHAGKSSINDRSYSNRLGGGEGKNILITAYARAVDKALRPVLRGDDRPLVLVATQPINSIYRQLNSYPALFSVGVEVSPDEMTPKELAEAIEPARRAYFEQLDTQRAELVEQRRGQFRLREDLAGVARAAAVGAIDTLFVDRDYAELGSISEAGDLDLSAHSYPVVEDLIAMVLATNGEVVAVDSSRLPAAHPLFAVLRWNF
jgi:hypothetical protein